MEVIPFTIHTSSPFIQSIIDFFVRSTHGFFSSQSSGQPSCLTCCGTSLYLSRFWRPTVGWTTKLRTEATNLLILSWVDQCAALLLLCWWVCHGPLVWVPCCELFWKGNVCPLWILGTCRKSLKHRDQSIQKCIHTCHLCMKVWRKRYLWMREREPRETRARILGCGVRMKIPTVFMRQPLGPKRSGIYPLEQCSIYGDNTIQQPLAKSAVGIHSIHAGQQTFVGNWHFGTNICSAYALFAFSTNYWSDIWDLIWMVEFDNELCMIATWLPNMLIVKHTGQCGQAAVCTANKLFAL